MAPSGASSTRLVDGSIRSTPLPDVPQPASQLVATSPGVIYKDLLIQGTRVGEGEGAAPGDVRAFDVRTGKLRWIFHTIPRATEPGAETWPAGSHGSAGGANS